MGKTLDIKEIKIGRFVYRVVFTDNEELHKIIGDEFKTGSMIFGIHDLEQEVIWLNKNISLKRQMHTLWHEINHALVYAGSMFMSDENGVSSEERLVDTIATQMIELVIDNPKLIKLTKEIMQ